MHGSKRHNVLMIRISTTLAVMISACMLSGCTGVGMLTGAAAVTGISAAQEGGLSRAATDTAIKVRINEAWFQYDVDAFRKLSTTVNQGRVLITGVVQNPEHRVEAVRLAWQVKDVEQVINEIRVAESEGVKGFVKDNWITSRLRGSLTLDRNVQSINYSIDTVQGIVYLMGVAQNQKELNHVIEKARTISGVKQVVSYVKLAGEPLNPDEQTEMQNAPPPKSEPVYNETNTNLNSRAPEDDVDVPARSVPENAPSIEDQYYNS
jgi:osmotically-inducible protein OsmY